MSLQKMKHSIYMADYRGDYCGAVWGRGEQCTLCILKIPYALPGLKILCVSGGREWEEKGRNIVDERVVTESTMRGNSGIKYMKERYWKIHSIKHGAEQNTGIAHISGCTAMEDKKTHCGTLFFYVEFRGNLDFFLLSCCWQTAVPEYGQDTGWDCQVSG